MLTIAKKRIVVVLGFILLAALIWWAWEFFEVTILGLRPDSVLVRTIVIAVVFGVWLGVLLVRKLRA
jgi:type VI protein secretion system component VasK